MTPKNKLNYTKSFGKIHLGSKTFHLVDPNQPGPSKETATPAKTDWSVCLLCQEATPELLQCPVQSKRHDVVLGQGYSSLAKNIRRFNELQEMPMPIDLRRLDAGSGMEATVLEHQAKWHPSCNRKFNTTARIMPDGYQSTSGTWPC